MADVRCDAVRIAMASNVPTEVLLPYLKDQVGLVRREAAIALAEAGEPVAIPSLLQEMRMRPSRAGLEALVFLWTKTLRSLWDRSPGSIRIGVPSSLRFWK